MKRAQQKKSNVKRVQHTNSKTCKEWNSERAQHEENTI